jgi:hypothetical protein
MDSAKMLAEVRAEIERLQKVAALLEGRDGASASRRGRRKLSAEARAKIAEAQRKRWAKAKREKA